MHRVLRPNGRLGVVVWSTADRVPLHAPARMVSEFMPPPAEERDLPGPLALGEPGLIEGIVSEAGFSQITVERRVVERVIEDPVAYWQQIVERGGDQLAAAIADRPADAERLRRRMTELLETHRDRQVIRLPGEAILVAARR
jgi:hypothetical protein